MHVFEHVSETVFIDFGRPWALKSECFASEGLQKQENQLFQKKYPKIIDFGITFWCILEVFGLTWATLGPTFAKVFAQLRSNTIFGEIWCPSPPRMVVGG